MSQNEFVGLKKLSFALIFLCAANTACGDSIPEILIFAPENDAAAFEVIGRSTKKNKYGMMEVTPNVVLNPRSELKSVGCTGETEIFKDTSQKIKGELSSAIEECDIDMEAGFVLNEGVKIECKKYINPSFDELLLSTGYCQGGQVKEGGLSGDTRIIISVISADLKYKKEVKDKLSGNAKCVAEHLAEAKIGYVGSRNTGIDFKSRGYGMIKTMSLKDICKNYKVSCGKLNHASCEGKNPCRDGLTPDDSRMCVPCGGSGEPICSKQLRGIKSHGCKSGFIPKERVCTACGAIGQPPCNHDDFICKPTHALKGDVCCKKVNKPIVTNPITAKIDSSNSGAVTEAQCRNNLDDQAKDICDARAEREGFSTVSYNFSRTNSKEKGCEGYESRKAATANFTCKFEDWQCKP